MKTAAYSRRHKSILGSDIMLVGTSQIDITPQPGIELVGFAVRPQPSDGVLDPLAVRGLYLEDGTERLLWLHADLLALDNGLVDNMRHWVERELDISSNRVLLSTTHTHSAPAAIHLNYCGRRNAEYVSWLVEQFQNAARAALATPEECQSISVEGHLELGMDRRHFPTTHTDPRVGAIGFCRGDGSYKAVLVIYAMHPVCLCETRISADWPGETARFLSRSLSGQPTVLVSSGACGNINPSAVGVTPEQMRDWGDQVAESVLKKLLTVKPNLPSTGSQILRVASTVVPIPLDIDSVEQISAHADCCLADPRGHSDFSTKYRMAIEDWREAMFERIRRDEPPFTQGELFGIALNDTVLLAVNAEIFSHFADLASRDANRPVYTLGCANGMIGYVPNAASYDEGAYEVDWAMFFYNLPRPRRGGLELLADHARKLVADLVASE
jgi:neutral ceramidase